MKLFETLKSDLPASVVVFFVALPLCLGIALVSGTPPVSGLIAGIIGGVIVGVLSGSPLGVSGPAAGLAVIVANGIEDLGTTKGLEGVEPLEAFFAAVVIAGALQIALGLARGGVVGYFFPASVIKGMLAGIGLVIILKQIPHAFGHDNDPEGDYTFAQPRSEGGETTIESLMNMVEDFAPGAIIVSSVALVILIVWETVLTKRSRVFQIVPGPLVAVVFGIFFQFITTRTGSSLALEESHLVQVPVFDHLGDVTASLQHPDLVAFKSKAVWVLGITMAIVASLETLLCVEATDKLDPDKRTTPTSRELFAQGCGNVCSGLIGGLPITQVIVRSSANIQSGGRTKLAAILHGFLLLIAVLSIPVVLNMVPLAALAAVLLVVGYKLAKPATFAAMYRQGWAQFVPFVVTILGIVFTDLLSGIMLGMAVAIFVILRSQYISSHFLHIERLAGGEQTRMRLAEEVSFLNKGALLKELKNIPDGANVLIDASSTVRIDQDAMEIIDDFIESADRRGITVELHGRFVATSSPRAAAASGEAERRATARTASGG